MQRVKFNVCIRNMAYKEIYGKMNYLCKSSHLISLKFNR